MARRRMLDPNIWDSEDYAQCSVFAKLLFIGMISNADDEGRGRAHPVFLKSKVFPYDIQINADDVDHALDEIAKTLSILFYTCDGCEYYAMRNWGKWQRVDRPQESKLPPYDADCCNLTRGSTFCPDGNIPDDAAALPAAVPPKGKEEKKKEENIKEVKRACAEVIDHLNKKAGTSYRKDSKKSLNRISDLLAQGYGADEMKCVIDKKHAEWNATVMERYLRPETLFGDKFEGYLNQKCSAAQNKNGKRLEYDHDYDLAALEAVLFDSG